MEGFLYKHTWLVQSQYEKQTFWLCIDRKTHVQYQKNSSSESLTPRIVVTEIGDCDGTCQSQVTIPTEVEKVITERLVPANHQRQPGLV